MKKTIISLDSCNYDNKSGHLYFMWHQEQSPLLTRRNDLTLKYQNIIPETITIEEAVDIWCATLLPHISVQFADALVHGPFTQSQEVFWLMYLKALGTSNNINLKSDKRISPSVKGLNGETNSLDRILDKKLEKPIALFFGGGG
jgi:hypothetical protein